MTDPQSLISNCTTEAELSDLEQLIATRRFELGIGKYSAAKIYNVRHIETDIIAYTGSTIKELKLRWSGHKSFFINCPDTVWAKYVAVNGGPDAFRIELVKHCPCRSLTDLLAIEKKCIDEFQPVCNLMLTAPSNVEKKWICFARKLLSARAASLVLPNDAIDVIKAALELNDKLTEEVWTPLCCYMLVPDHLQHAIHICCEMGVQFENKGKMSSWIESSNKAADSIKGLCSVLGLENSLDTFKVVSEERILNSIAEIQMLCRDFREIIKCETSTSKSDDVVKQVRLDINKVLFKWSGVKLASGMRSRFRGDGSRKRPYRYNFRMSPADPALQALAQMVKAI